MKPGEAARGVSGIPVELEEGIAAGEAAGRKAPLYVAISLLQRAERL